MRVNFKSNIVCLALLLWTIQLSASSSTLPYWRDIKVVSVNKLTAATEFAIYDSRESALEGRFTNSPYYKSLNGEWQFAYYSNDTIIPPDIASEQSKIKWGKITVPGNWELQGHGTALYTNHPYEFSPHNPQPPALPQNTPVGIYRRTFEVPTKWVGHDVFINLDGAKSGVYVYINGKEVGYSENSKDPAAFNITPYLNKTSTKNTLVVKIYRWSTGSYLECQDFWRISGIERDVYLNARPRGAIRDFNIVSTLDKNLRDGIFHLNIAGGSDKISYTIMDNDSKIVASGDQGRDFVARINSANIWSAENPYLYTLVINDGKYYIPFKVGFRHFEISPSDMVDSKGKPYMQFLVNGKAVKFKGVNIHEHNPATGHYWPEELMRKDLMLLQTNNINAVRTSHYPFARRFYELCDSIGIYVYSEANIESHGMGYKLDRTLGNNPQWLNHHIDRIEGMYSRLKNYPSVTIWSLGNEAGNGSNFYDAYRWIAKQEKGNNKMNRPICYERALMEWNTDMLVPQYPNHKWLETKGMDGVDRPVVPSEYSHAMGNSNGGLSRQWDHIYRYPNLQGGFIWDWVDQGFDATDSNGRHYWTYGGDYGVNSPSDGNFVCNGIVNPDRTPHPAMAEVKYAYSNVAFIPRADSIWIYEVANRFYFTTLSDYTIRYTILRNGTPWHIGTLRVDIPAQSSEIVSIPRKKLKSDAVYHLRFDVLTNRERFFIPSGHIIASDQFLLSDITKKPYKESNSAKLKLTDNNITTTVSSKKFSVVFDKKQGHFTSYNIKGKEFFVDGFGLRPLFWRGTTDNDYGNKMASLMQPWKQATNRSQCSATAVKNDNSVVITATYELPYASSMIVRYTIYSSGIINLQSEYNPSPKSNGEIPRLGFRFRLPAQMEKFSYFARGTEENYSDRKRGSFEGLYQSSASAGYFPYVRPQENGHHCDSRWIDFEKLYIVSDTLFEFNVLRNSVEDFDCEENRDKPYQWHNFSPNEQHDTKKAENVMRRQTHINDITAQPFTEVCIDYRHRGVGGYDSWGSKPDYDCTIDASKVYKWGFTLVPAGAVANAASAWALTFNTNKY